jgi:hypothetical protein
MRRLFFLLLLIYSTMTCANYFHLSFPILLSHLGEDHFHATIYFDRCTRHSAITDNTLIEELATSHYAFQIEQVYRRNALNISQVEEDAVHLNSSFFTAKPTVPGRITIEVTAFADLETVLVHMSFFDPAAHKITASADWDCTNAFMICGARRLGAGAARRLEVDGARQLEMEHCGGL